MKALVIEIHNRLSLSKMFIFNLVYDTFKAVTVELGSCPHSGSGWENPNRWSARDKPNLGFRTSEKLAKKTNKIIIMMMMKSGGSSSEHYL